MNAASTPSTSATLIRRAGAVPRRRLVSLALVALALGAAACSSSSNNNSNSANSGAATQSATRQAAASAAGTNVAQAPAGAGTPGAPAAGTAAAAGTPAATGGNVIAPAGVVAADKALAAAAGKGSSIDQVTLSKPVTINFWETSTDTSAAGQKLAALIKDFESQNPNITVNAQYIGTYNDEFQKNQTAIAGGQSPDLSVAYENEVATYQTANVVVPLDDYIKSQKYGLQQDDYLDILQAYRYDNFYAAYNNQMLSFPWTKSVELMYYNADQLKSAGVAVPQTWDDFLKAARAVSTNGVKAYAISIDPSWFATGMYSRGAAILSDDQKKAVFNSDAGVAQLQVFQQMAKHGTAYQTAQGSDDGTDFAAGKTTFNFESSARLATYRNSVGSKFTWGVALPPHGAGATQATDMFGGNITMFKSTPERQLASWLFIKYFTSKTVNPDWSTSTGYLPIRTSGMSDPKVQAAIQTFPQYAVAVQAQQYGRPEPNVRQWNDIRAAIQDAMVAALADPNKSAKSLLDDAVSRANQALSQ